jgi:DNA-binding NtrC family response regulator
MIPVLARAGIAGSGPAMEQVATLIGQVAATDLSVLVTGESGTGKELVARAIHENSQRATKDMITVNCGAIPEGIFESEIFGHERGSFTGAERQRKGMFELADNSTIFLDEIGEMPLFTQVKILRVLETGEFMRVGGQSPIKVNVRVVAATNRDLAVEVHEGRFRQDLYFRLKAVNVLIPPLRDRPEDIPELVSLLIKRFCEKNTLPISELTPEAMELLKGHYWQGNVRELKNFIESLLIISGSRILELNVVQERLQQQGSSPNLPVLSTQTQQPEFSLEMLQQMFYYLQRELAEIKDMNRKLLDQQQQVHEQADLASMTVDELEHDHIREVLIEFGGNRGRAAASLGISERTLYRKIRKYGL